MTPVPFTNWNEPVEAFVVTGAVCATELSIPGMLVANEKPFGNAVGKVTVTVAPLATLVTYPVLNINPEGIT